MAHEDFFQNILQTTTHFDLNLIEDDNSKIDDLLGQSTILSRTAEVLKSIKEFYDVGLFYDLKMVAGNADLGFNSVACHSLVLVSAIPDFKQILEAALLTSPEEEFARIYLPEFCFEDLKNFVDSIYSSLNSSKDVFIPIPLAQSLGLVPEFASSNMIIMPCIAMKNVSSTKIHKEPCNVVYQLKELKAEEPSYNFLQRNTRRSTRKRKISSDDTSMPLAEDDTDFDISVEKKERSRKKTKGCKSNVAFSQSTNEISVLCSLSLENVTAEQMNNLHQSMPYSWALSDPSLFSNASEYQKLLETCSDSGTVVHALTGPHFNFTHEVNSGSKDLCYSNKMSRLAFLPNTTICAVIAVGIRGDINIIQPLALKGWPVKANFESLLEMLLNISGTSKGQFFAHDRYYLFKKMSSKPNRVGRALQGLKKLSEDDRHLLQMETQKQMADLESRRPRLNFSHLPLISVKMQFSHVSDMATEEIMDYAVLYGDTANDLKIKSFSHLQVRDYAEADWISIFIDLMVDIFDVENPFALRNHLNTKDLFDSVDQLVFRHQAFELLGNPSKKYCIPCRTVFPYSNAEEMEQFEAHSQEHSIKRQETAGQLTCTGSNKCSKLFQNQSALAEHVAKCHSKEKIGEGSYCDTCGKFLPNVHRLKKHNDAHHRPIKCKVCGDLFSGTIGLASHRDRAHSQQLPCPHCNKLLPSRVKLEYHMISHMAPEEKKYICEKCGKRFGWSHHLAKHEMNVHVRSRPYKCSVHGCNWAFNDLSNRNMHERRVHKIGPPPRR